jgi:LIVCS family branched-chain amino acid:cation transporter
MKERLNLKSSVLIGSLLFGLFFGAGNLIFPVQMGQLAGRNTLHATIGFLITGVGLPLLGVIASALSRSESLYDMAKPVNRAYSIFFPIEHQASHMTHKSLLNPCRCPHPTSLLPGQEYGLE